jgi:hypothetical protein
MSKINAEYSKDLHYLWWLALGCVVGVLVYLLNPILTPFLLAAVIAYICQLHGFVPGRQKNTANIGDSPGNVVAVKSICRTDFNYAAYF